MKKGKQSVKNRIIDAAWELFHEKGYDNTTVDDIIRLSKTSKGSYYYYFESKDSLLSTLSDVLDEKYEELRETMDPHQNSFDKLMYLCYEVHSMMEKKMDYELLASLYSSQLITKGDRHLLDQNRTYYKLIRSIVEEGQTRGEITSDKTAAEITKLYGLCERALVSDWCMSKGEYSLGEYSREYMPLLFEHFREKQ
ncbi:MAG: TetR/AcrR family transcriptional regulator [Lachnospiraceae bacterium]